jgi:hypothetical protein
MEWVRRRPLKLLAHQGQWGTEPVPSAAALVRLDASEAAL